MAFVVEDGTGLTNSNSYAAVADADSYFTDRGNTAWAALTNDEKQIALIKGTDYLDGTYRFKGTKSDSAQALQWPRDDVYDDEGNEISGIPEALKKATYEASYKSISADLFQDIDKGAVKKEKVEGAVEVEYFEGGSSQISFLAVENLLYAAGLIKGKIAKGGSVPVVRV